MSEESIGGKRKYGVGESLIILGSLLFSIIFSFESIILQERGLFIVGVLLFVADLIFYKLSFDQHNEIAEQPLNQ